MGGDKHQDSPRTPQLQRFRPHTGFRSGDNSKGRERTAAAAALTSYRTELPKFILGRHAKPIIQGGDSGLKLFLSIDRGKNGSGHAGQGGGERDVGVGTTAAELSVRRGPKPKTERSPVATGLQCGHPWGHLGARVLFRLH